MSKVTQLRLKERSQHRLQNLKRKGESDLTKEELSLQFIGGTFKPDNLGWLQALRPGLYTDINSAGKSISKMTGRAGV